MATRKECKGLSEPQHHAQDMPGCKQGRDLTPLTPGLGFETSTSRAAGGITPGLQGWQSRAGHTHAPGADLQ